MQCLGNYLTKLYDYSFKAQILKKKKKKSWYPDPKFLKYPALKNFQVYILPDTSENVNILS